MRTRHAYLAVLVAASAAFVLTSSAAMAQKKGKASPRDAAIQECIAKAQASDPLPSPEASQRRVAVYKACMTQMRQRP